MHLCGHHRQTCAGRGPTLDHLVSFLMPQGNRGFAFALFYAVMNIAALSVGIVLDFFRVTIKRGLDIASLPPTSLLNNGMRLFILTGEIHRPLTGTR